MMNLGLGEIFDTIDKRMGTEVDDKIDRSWQPEPLREEDYSDHADYDDEDNYNPWINGYDDEDDDYYYDDEYTPW